MYQNIHHNSVVFEINTNMHKKNKKNPSFGFKAM